VEGDLEYEGFLNKLIAAEGTLEEFGDRLHEILPTAQVITPKPCQRISIPLNAKPSLLQTNP
jgi:hypothetical protein